MTAGRSDRAGLVGWLTRNNPPVETVALILGIVLTITAGIVAYWQFNTQWQLENERGAKAAFREYLKISLDHPHLARPDPENRPLNAQEQEQYFWYISLMNETFEEVFAHVPDLEAWTDLAEVQIGAHCAFFQGADYVPALYSERFQNLVIQTLGTNPLGACE